MSRLCVKTSKISALCLLTRLKTAARSPEFLLSSVLHAASSMLPPPLIQQVLLPSRHYLCSLLYRAVFLRSTVSLAARCLPFQAHGRVRNAVEVAFHPEVRALDLLGTACWACGCGRAVRDDIKLLTTERIGCNITFDKVAREWRCKYAADASGGPADSASLKAAEELLQSYLPTLKALPNAEVTRVMCGGCHDFVRRPRLCLFVTKRKLTHAPHRRKSS